MDQWHLTFAWLWLLVGIISGAIIGSFFHSEEWLGGYTSWPRRMIRLGHIAFFGLGLFNMSFALTLRAFQIECTSTWTSPLLIFGSVCMPLVCYLSALKKVFRHLFFIPVLSLFIGVSLFFFGDILP